ncbi:hypothetical protein L0Y59_00795 [Candidatus Uhrbacteria bacterium]|nr:hypothetical protein [Candidatus Uhrbacteria bacterium]
MPEPIIHDSTPKGSAILAYGESPSGRRTPIILAFAAGVIAFVCVAAIAAATLDTAVPLPEAPISLLYLTPDAKMPAEAPDAWVTARDAAMPFPVLVGYRRDDGGGVMPFAILPRLSGSGGETTWAFRLLDGGERTSRTSLFRLAGSAHALFADAWLRMWPSRLLPGLDGILGNESVAGTITDSSWTTDVTTTIDGADSTAGVGRNFIVLEAFPGAWPSIESLFRTRGIMLRLSVPPKTATWSSDADGRLSVRLTYHDSLPESVRADIAGTVGIAGEAPLILEDDTVAEERLLETGGFENATSVAGTEDLIAVFQDVTVIVSPNGSEPESLQPPISCKGDVLAAFEIGVMFGLSEPLGIPMLPGSPQRILWMNEGGFVTACW